MKLQDNVRAVVVKEVQLRDPVTRSLRVRCTAAPAPAPAEGPRTPTGGGDPMIGLKKMPDTTSGFQNELLVQTGFQAGFWCISPRATTLQLQDIYLDHEKKKMKKKESTTCMHVVGRRSSAVSSCSSSSCVTY